MAPGQGPVHGEAREKGPAAARELQLKLRDHDKVGRRANPHAALAHHACAPSQTQRYAEQLAAVCEATVSRLLERETRTAREHVPRGAYVPHSFRRRLKRWAEAFSRDQLLVFEMDWVLANPQDAMRRLGEFRRLDRAPAGAMIKSNIAPPSQRGAMTCRLRDRLQALYGPKNDELYAYLAATGGPLMALLVVLAQVAYQGSTVVTSWWLGFWASHDGERIAGATLNKDLGLGVYVVVSTAAALPSVLSYGVASYLGQNAARVTSEEMVPWCSVSSTARERLASSPSRRPSLGALSSLAACRVVCDRMM